jgi:hypothetical protein
MRMRALFVGVVLAATATSCSSTKTFNQKDLQNQIADQLANKVGQRPASVTCPDNVKAKTGTKFRCTLTADDGSKIGLTGTATSDSGRFSIEVDQQLSSPPTSGS